MATRQIEKVAWDVPPRKKPDKPVCWICGVDADSGEHKAKRSDLKAVFGNPTQEKPLYLHDERAQGQPVRSLDAHLLKWDELICAECNTTLTQPFDRAWEHLSAYLRGRQPALRPGAIVRTNRLFSMNTTQQMLNVHLYFVKMFGCAMVENNIPIDIGTFSKAILNARAHPDFYLEFGSTTAVDQPPSVSASKGYLLKQRHDDKCVFVCWIYNVAGLRVAMVFADDQGRLSRERRLWHPRLGSNRFVVASVD